jgi:hypothetical protein
MSADLFIDVTEATQQPQDGRGWPVGAAAPPSGRKPATGRPGRREKMFGLGRPRPLDRNAKARIIHLARCLMRPIEKGKHYGAVTAKAFAVLEALLWGFHNAASGLCYPGYERIAEAAGCARSTVAEALKGLEEAGILTWVHRIKRVRERCLDLLGDSGWRWRVQRTSNAYNFCDPKGGAGQGISSKSDFQSGTPIQDLDSSPKSAATPKKELDDGLAASLAWFGRRIHRKAEAKPA